MMEVTTVLRDWYLVDFELDGEDAGVLIAWGIVERDPSCRWSPGDYCCTSPVKEEVQDGEELFAVTRNSNYQLSGSGERITMPARTIFALRQGYSPREILASAALREV